MFASLTRWTGRLLLGGVLMAGASAGMAQDRYRDPLTEDDREFGNYPSRSVEDRYYDDYYQRNDGRAYEDAGRYEAPAPRYRSEQPSRYTPDELLYDNAGGLSDRPLRDGYSRPRPSRENARPARYEDESLAGYEDRPASRPRAYEDDYDRPARPEGRPQGTRPRRPRSEESDLSFDTRSRQLERRQIDRLQDVDWERDQVPAPRPRNERPLNDRPMNDRPYEGGRDEGRYAPPAGPDYRENNYRPQAPTAPARTKAAEATTEQKIAARYSDPRILRTLDGLTAQQAESFFMETSQLIDTRHLSPSDYNRRTQQALENLIVAVTVPAFVQANRVPTNPQAVQAFQQTLHQMRGQTQVNSSQEALQVMRQAAQVAGQYLQLRPQAVSMEFVYGSIATLDQYSAFVPPEKATGGPSTGLDSNFVGIGVEVEPHPQGLKIVKALRDGPAAQATLKRGDVISAVNGRQLAGMDLSTAVDMIKGPANSPLQLQVKRDGMVADVQLVRRQVQVYNVSEVRMQDEANKVGYIKLDQFGETATKEVDQALWNLHNQGMQSLVLDLRGNPGGLLTAAIEISDRFLPSGTIVSTRGRTPSDNMQEAAKQPETWKVPLVVLVDHNSASASEILAAAIQENGRGVIIGERSYGKGTVQTHFPLSTVSGGLKLTTGKFYSPTGREMAGAGVTPDVPVASMAMDDDRFDSGMQAALETIARNGMNNPNMPISQR